MAEEISIAREAARAAAGAPRDSERDGWLEKAVAVSVGASAAVAREGPAVPSAVSLAARSVPGADRLPLLPGGRCAAEEVSAVSRPGGVRGAASFLTGGLKRGARSFGAAASGDGTERSADRLTPSAG